jgi:microcystin-dependent protein
VADPFLGEVRIMGFGFAPKGWAQCLGQTLAIQQNRALWSLLGNMYGGNGTTTFALPDFAARVPVHVSPAMQQGQAGGEAAHPLTAAEMPSHSHSVSASLEKPPQSQPSAATYVANSAPANIWGPLQAAQTMQGTMIGTAGGNVPHENRMPFLALNFCIALAGIYPTAT